jgi:imidazolonepropionase-like amidohydrolase
MIQIMRSTMWRATFFAALLASLGVIGRGMAADIIAVDGNPLETLSTLRRPMLLMLRGHLVQLQ